MISDACLCRLWRQEVFVVASQGTKQIAVVIHAKQLMWVDPESEGTADEPEMEPEEQAMDTGNKTVNGIFGKLSDLGFTLDVIENPLNVVKLFLGQDIDLITWDAPELDLSFEIERSFPLVLGISGEISGAFSIYSDLYFGFDTYGLSQWKEQDFALQYSYLVFDGFYVSDVDPETGEDVDELTLEATIRIGVELNAVVVQFSGGGGVTGSAALDLIDVGERSGESDGRLRGSEILANINKPGNLFAVTGAIEAFLDMSISVGIDLGFWEITETVWERELARFTLFEFEIGGGGGGGALLSSTIGETEEALTSTESDSSVENYAVSQVSVAYSNHSPATDESLPPATIPLALEEASVVTIAEQLAVNGVRSDVVHQPAVDSSLVNWMLSGSPWNDNRSGSRTSSDFSILQRDHESKLNEPTWENVPASRLEHFSKLRDGFLDEEIADLLAREVKESEKDPEDEFERLEAAFAVFR